MTRWILLGALLGVGVGIFVWWRGGVLHTLPTAAPSFSTSTPPLPAVTAGREALLQFENENLAAKVKRLSVRFSTGTDASGEMALSPKKATSTPTPAAPKSIAPTSTSAFPPPPDPPKTVSSVAPSSTLTTPSSATPVVQATTISTSTPAASPKPRQQFLIDGKGFCVYVRGNSSVTLSGYPLVVDTSIQDENIKSWTDDRVVFWTPDGIPPGTYRAIVRGVNQFGYCTASTSSPQTITVQ